MNLVSTDASGTAKPLISKVTSILRRLRNHRADTAELKNAKMPRPVLHVDTRWNSVADSSEYLTTHLSIISLIFVKTLGPQDTLYRYMEQIQIKRSAQDLNTYKPVGIALDKLRSDGVYLGDVVEIRFQLRSVCPEEYLKKKLLLGQVYDRSSMQPSYWITDTSFLTWIMLKYVRPCSTSTNVRMMLPQRSRNTWPR